MSHDDESSEPTQSRGGGVGVVRAVSRWLRPSTLGLVLIAFALPFLTVSCDTPGGFGHVSAGGTTSWSGYDLLSGSEPGRTAEHLLPAAESATDDLGLQPLVLMAYALVVAATVCALVIRARQRCRLVTVVLAGLASVGLAAGLLLARAQAVTLVSEQLADREIPPDRTIASFVDVGGGYVICQVLLGVVLVVDLVWWLAGRRRAAGGTDSAGSGVGAVR